MEYDPSLAGRLKGWLGPLRYGVTWLVFLLLAVILGFVIMRQFGLMANVEGVLSWEWRLLTLLLKICEFLVAFTLARRFGGAPGQTKWPLLLGVAILQMTLSIGLSAATASITWMVFPEPNAGTRYLVGCLTIMRFLVLLPLNVWIVSAVHGAGRPGPGTILGYLVKAGSGLLFVGVVLQFTFLVLNPIAYGTPGEPMMVFQVLLYLFNAAFQMIVMWLFYIMVYREIRSVARDREDVFT